MTYYGDLSAPFILDANKKPIIGSWIGGTSANSVIIINIVAKALMASQ